MAWFSDRDRRRTEGDPTGSRYTRRDGWEPTRPVTGRFEEAPRRSDQDDDRYWNRGQDVNWGRDRDRDWDDDEHRMRGRDDRFRDEGRLIDERTYRARDFDDDSPRRVRQFDRGEDRFYRGQGYERTYDEREQPVDDGGYWGDDRERERGFRMPSGRDSERVREMRTRGLDYGDRGPQQQQTGQYRSYLDSDRFSDQDFGEQNRRYDDRGRYEDNREWDRQTSGQGFRSMGGQSWRASDRDFGPHVGRGPRGWQRSDERIQDEICEALWRHGTVDASDVNVTVENGEVTLDGFVRTRYEKRLAEDEAERIDGVRDVHNRLRVGTDDRQRGDRDRAGTRDQTYSPTEASTSVTTVASGQAPENARGMSAPRGLDIREGMDVFSSDGENLGNVKQARESDFLLDRSMSFDVFVPFDLVSNTVGNRVTLSVTKDELGDMDLQKPALDDWGTGAESSQTTGTATS